MKERPILMNTIQVNATLEDRKTMHRLIVNPQSAELERGNGTVHPAYLEDNGDWYYRDPDDWSAHDVQYKLLKCPFGNPGDLLWVRETWRTLKHYDKLPPSLLPGNAPIFFETDEDWHTVGGKIRSKLFLPTRFARLWREAVSVKVERVQDIGAIDAVLEGYPHHMEDENVPDPVEWFKLLWNSIHGECAWDRNDWVWVVEFRRIEK